MSKEQIEKLESGTHVLIPRGERWLRYTSLISVVLLVFAMGAWTSASRGLMFDDKGQKNTVITHSHPDSEGYKAVHMTLEEAQDQFVTRREYQLLMKGQEDIKRLIIEK